jgi:hypothetical protein
LDFLRVNTASKSKYLSPARLPDNWQALYCLYCLPNADVKDFSNGSTTPVNCSYLRYNACRRHSGPHWCFMTKTATEYIIVLLIMFFSHKFVK